MLMYYLACTNTVNSVIDRSQNVTKHVKITLKKANMPTVAKYVITMPLSPHKDVTNNEQPLDVAKYYGLDSLDGPVFVIPT